MYGRSENKKFPENVDQLGFWVPRVKRSDFSSRSYYEVHLSCAYDVNVDLCFFVLRISYLK